MPPIAEPDPVTITLRETGTTDVRGYPGVQGTIPRIETLVLIRHRIPGNTFNLQRVQVKLITHQRVAVPLNFGAHNCQHEYTLFHDANVFRSPKGTPYEQMIGCDIPLRIFLPKDIVSSGTFPTWKALAWTKLVIEITLHTSIGSQTFQESFPISILQFDSLPIYKELGKAVDRKCTSPDSQVLVELQLARSSVGPGDVINLQLKITKLMYRKNISLKEITYLLWEILEGHDSGLPRHKEQQIYSTSNEWSLHELPLSTNPIQHEFSKPLSLLRDFLEFHTSDLDIKDQYFNPYNDPLVIVTLLNNFRNVEVIDQFGIPITHTEGFTSSGKLYSVRFELRTKVKFYGSKSVKFNLPITICPFDYQTSKYLLYWIEKECQLAKELLGPVMFSKIFNAIDYKLAASMLMKTVPPTTIYRDCLNDWTQMGYPSNGFRQQNIRARIGFYVD